MWTSASPATDNPGSNFKEDDGQRPRPPGRWSRRVTRLLLAGTLGFGMMAVAPGMRPVAAQTQSALYEDAVLAAQDRNYDVARRHLQTLLESDPTYLPARILLGDVLLAVGDVQAAEAQLLQALNAGGDPRLILVALGQAELLQGKTNELLNDLTLEGGSPALQADVSNLRGYAYLERGQLTEARAAFRRAAEQVATNPTPYVGLARAALLDNDPATAADYAERAFDIGANGAVWRLRGDISADRGEDDAAISAYGRAIDLAWGDMDARTARATLLIRKGRLDEAMADLAVVREIIPHDLEAVYLTALILTEQGKREEATALLRQGKRGIERMLPAAMSDNRTVLRMAGLICYALGDFSEAAGHFERLATVSPSDDNALSLLARTRIHLGEYATAIRDLQSALTIDNGNPETQGLLGLVYMLRGELEAAVDHLSLAAAHGPAAGTQSVRLGVGLLRLDRTDDAMAAFAEARRAATGDNLAATLLTAMGAMQQRDFQTAVEWALRAVEIAPDSPYTRHIAAVALINAGQESEARKHLQAALNQDEEFVPARLELARLMTRTGNIRGARTAYRDILTIDRVNAAAMLELADLARLEEKWEEAEKLLQTARDENPDLEGVWIRSAAFYAARGDMERAQALANEFIRDNPDALAIRNRLAVLLWRANHLEEAVTQYQNLLEVSLDRGATLYRIGLVREDMGQYDDAITAFRRAAGWLPDNRAIWRKIIILEARSGDLTEAQRLLADYRDRGIAGDIDTLTGEMYLATGDFRKSLRAFEAARSKAPGSVTVARGIFESLRNLDREDAAMAHLSQWLEDHEDDDIQTTLALAYADAGRLDDAIALHLDTLSRHPDSIPVLNNLGLLYMRAGDTQTARDYASKALELGPDLPAVLDTFGWIMVNAGEPADGLAVLREAQARAGGHARVHYHTAVALRQLARDTEARSELEAALQSEEEFPEREAAQALLTELAAN